MFVSLRFGSVILISYGSAVVFTTCSIQLYMPDPVPYLSRKKLSSKGGDPMAEIP
jgi:hypothetical protein